MSEKVFGSEKKGSIQDIPLPTHPSENTLNLQGEETPDSHERNVEGWGAAKRKNKRTKAKLFIFVLLALAAVLFYSWFFHSASVVIDPKSQSVQVANQEFKAVIQGDDGLEFIRVNPYTKTISSHIEGSLEENRQTKASGLITVYNSDSTDKNYIKNTRFQTEDGRVYRAFQRFVIPAGSLDNPGSVDVLVYAENPGEKFNSLEGLTFTLPALKENGDPAFDLVSAVQKEELSGGFSGVIKVPSIDDINDEKIALRARLEKELKQDFAATLPANYIVNEDYLSISDITYTEKPNSQKGGIDLEARAELNSVVFEKAKFDAFMARELLQEVSQTDEISVANTQELTMTIQEDDFDPTSTEVFTFTITGEVDFVWQLEQEQVKNLLAGKLKSHIENGLVPGLSNTNNVDITVSPFWRRSLPNDAEDIEVTIK